ncbi:MAG: DUF805 domain-containing protein [Rhizomicrobium sp.]|nr:DUF805 domain-containing protein [Rhizomicrobium sp.]
MFQFVFGFRGRIDRAKMWLVFLLSSLGLSAPFAIVLMVLEETLIGVNPRPTTLSPAVSGALCLWSVIVFYAMVAAVVKRLHDRGKSAAWLVLFFGIPIACFVAAYFIGWPPKAVSAGTGIVMSVLFVIVLLNNLWYLLEVLVLPGTRGDNRFGPDPRADTFGTMS